MSAVLVPVAEIQEQTALWPLTAAELEVADQPSLERAGELLQDIKTLRAEIARFCDPVIEATHKAHKAAVAQKRELDADLVEADQIIRLKVGRYTDQQRQLERQAAAQALAVQRAALQQAEHDAAKLRAAGDHAAAELVVVAAEIASTPPAPAPAAKAKGVSTPERWHAEVTDLAALVRAIAEGRAPLSLVQPNMTALHGMARALKDQLGLPGVVARREVGVSVRRG